MQGIRINAKGVVTIPFGVVGTPEVDLRTVFRAMKVLGASTSPPPAMPKGVVRSSR